MTLLIDQSIPGTAQTHALVIGIGTYPHLLGGMPGNAPNSFGLRQLSSPPLSATAFADWLLTRFHNKDAPLASLDLLVSEGDGPTRYVLPKERKEPADQQHPVSLGLPTKDALKSAIRAWKARADGHADNIAVFYFCGHGLSNRAETALLARDFGSPSGLTMEGAVDFDAVLMGMEGCRARRQCYFIDACRNEPRALLDLDDMGDRQVLEQSVLAVHPTPRKYPVYYATARNERAHALANDVSRFTKALLCALNGAGSRDPDGTYWVVNTITLAEGIAIGLELGNRRPGVPLQEAMPGGSLGSFDLHFLRHVPSVPVAVRCLPRQVRRKAELVVTPPGLMAKPPLPPDADEWQMELDVIPGEYIFEVRSTDGGWKADPKSLLVRPSHRDMCIEVQP